MSLADASAALIVLGLSAYAVLAGADFGTGVWELSAGRRRAEFGDLIDRSMGPVWEANHVWLIFVLVVTWTAFPPAFGAAMSTLALPLMIALVGIILRGAAFATRGAAGSGRARRGFAALFALSSLITPFFLGAALGGIASGRVPAGNAAGDAITSWWNPTSVLAGALAVATGAHLAAVYLAADARRRGRTALVAPFRRRAIASGVVAGAIALAGLAVVRSDARPLYDALVGGALWLVVLSGVAGLATIALVARGMLGWARIAGAAAVAALIWGWAAAQGPALLPGAYTVDQAAAPHATLVAVLVGTGLGMLVLVPSLALLFILALRGRLDAGHGDATEGPS